MFNHNRIRLKRMLRAILVLFLITAFMFSALPAKAQKQQGFLHKEDFSSADWDSEWRSGWANAAYMDIVPGYIGDGVQVNIPRGSHHGADRRLPLKPLVGYDPQMLHYTYMVRIDEGWLNESPGKLPGPAGVYTGTGAGTYPSTPSRPGWSARTQFTADYGGAHPGETKIGQYVYHLDQPDPHGETLEYNSRGLLRHGEWYCIQGYIRLNTPGEHDGIIRIWVDRELAAEKTDYAFRRSAEDHIGINWFWFDVYFGGKRTPSTDQSVTIDELTISDQKTACPMNAADYAEFIEQLQHFLQKYFGPIRSVFHYPY